MKNRNIKVKIFLISILAVASIFIFGSKKLNANADKEVYESNVMKELPKALRHTFKASDGSYFKGSKNSYTFNDEKNNMKFHAIDVHYIMSLYKSNNNSFVMASRNRIYITVIFTGKYEKINKFQIRYTKPGTMTGKHYFSKSLTLNN